MMCSLKNEQEFNEWLSNIPDNIQNLVTSLPSSLRINLENYDIEATRELSEWVLQNVSDINEIKKNSKLWGEIASYFGEVFIRMLDGRWDIELEDEDNVFYRKPVIFTKNSGPFSPFSLVTALLARKNSSFIPTIIKNQLPPQK